MHMLTIALTTCCLAVAQPTYHSGYDNTLNSVPDIGHYSKISYPHLDILELGEYSHGEHHPEVIKIVKTVEVKVPQPYPVEVPHKVPYPVPYKVPHIIKVPQVIKVTQPVPVEVVKPVHVPSGNEHSDLSGGDAFGKGSLDSDSLGLYNGGHNTDWQGVSSPAYGGSSGSFDAGAGASGLEGIHGDIAQQALLAGHGNVGQFDNGADYSAQASSDAYQQQGQGVEAAVQQSQEEAH